MLELLLTKGFPVAVAKDHPDNEYPNQDERCAKYGWDETIRHRIAPVEIVYALHVRSAGNPCLSRAKSLSGPVRHDLLRRSGAIVHSTSIRIDGLGPLCESQGLLPYQLPRPPEPVLLDKLRFLLKSVNPLGSHR